MYIYIVFTSKSSYPVWKDEQKKHPTHIHTHSFKLCPNAMELNRRRYRNCDCITAKYWSNTADHARGYALPTKK